MTDSLLGQIASHGIVGTMLGLALLALRAKDKELKAEMAARIEDAQKLNTIAMALQREVIQAVHKLSEMLAIWERRDEERQNRNRGGGLR